MPQRHALGDATIVSARSDRYRENADFWLPFFPDGENDASRAMQDEIGSSPTSSVDDLFMDREMHTVLAAVLPGS
jgi:hypothetical protein